MGDASAHSACLVALHAWPAVQPDVQGPLGGIETRAWTLSRGLAAAGTPVTLVVRHPALSQPTQVEGVQIAPLTPDVPCWVTDVRENLIPTATFPFRRLRKFQWDLLWKLPVLAACYRDSRRLSAAFRPDPQLLRLQPRAFVTLGVQRYAARVIGSGFASGRPTVLSIAHDDDLHELAAAAAPGENRYGDSFRLCGEIVRRATAVVVQTEEQRELLQARFGRAGTLIPNPFDADRWVPSTSASGEHVLWVGRADGIYKRPELAFELAHRCPHIPFRFVFSAFDTAYEQQLRERCPPNVIVMPQVPFERMPTEYARARLLLNTSSREGFPNTFLQAAASGVFIASTTVGAKFLNDYHAGQLIGDDLDVAARQLAQLWATVPPVANIERLRKDFGIANVVAQWQKLLRSLPAQPAS